MLNHSLVPVGSTGGYSIDNSLRFNDAYLSRAFGTPTSTTTGTYSTWVKLSEIANTRRNLFYCYNGSAASQISLEIGASGQSAQDALMFNFGNTGNYVQITSKLFRDPSAWYHIIVAMDTTQATASNRVKIYVNNEQITSWSAETYPPQNTVNQFCGASGTSYISDSSQWDGYMADTYWVDGQALTPADFGETDEDYGHWKAKAYEGTYGTNGFYLDFKNSGSLGNDASSNSNNWTPNNLSTYDQMLDSPTNNFCTLNPLGDYNSSLSFLEGNLQFKDISTANGSVGGGTILLPKSGKWYWEVQCEENSNTTAAFGVAAVSLFGNLPSGDAYGLTESAVYADHGATWKNGSSVTSSLSTFQTQGQVLGIAYDADALSVKFYHNDTLQDTVTGLTDVDYMPTIIKGKTSGNWSVDNVLNFGQDSSFAGNKTAQGNQDSNDIGDFYYAPPTGFLALCTQNLPEPTVVPSEHFNTVLWTGNSSTQSITGVGFQPDFTWIKSRAAVHNHYLQDSIRGATKQLESSTTASEQSLTNALTSFDSDGFSLGSHGNVNSSADGTYVAWNWKANGAGVSNTNGTITSTVSANVDAGFSIVSYTGNGTAGATVGHGLTSAPEMIFVKNRDRSAAGAWQVYNVTNGATKSMELNEAGTASTSSIRWNDTTPTSSVFTVGSSLEVNGSGEDVIGYAFHSVEGYSKVGSYTGNGSTDGTFVHCGFRPAYVMIKKASAAASWYMTDSKRYDTNRPYGSAAYLFADSSAAESTTENIDMLSNGFKARRDSGYFNYPSGATYIYIAFAEHPFKHSNAR